MTSSPERVEPAGYDSVSLEFITEITERVKRERRSKHPLLSLSLVKLSTNLY
jgi:hypothetical protein